MKIHPHVALLEELASGLGKEHGTLLRHLAVCGLCRDRLGTLLEGRRNRLAEKLSSLLRWPVDSGYDAVLLKTEHVFLERQRVLGAERAAAPGLLRELTERPAEKRLLLLWNSPRYHTWGLFELLVAQSREQCFEEPAWGEELARLALDLSDFLDAAYYGAERIEDLRARAWGCMANSKRMRADFEGAEAAFRTAFSLLRTGTGDSLERGILLDLKASLRTDQRRFEEARRLLRRAFSIFLELGETHRAGRALVSMETVHHYAGTPQQGIPLLYQALELIDPAQEPRLLLCAWHNLIHDLAEEGRFLEAQKLFGKARPVYDRFPEPWAQNRRRWVEAKIAHGLGRHAEAESLFRSVRDALSAADLPYDTALVSLELAALYAEQGRLQELKHLGEELVPIFASRQIHREALAALALWQRAAEAETVSRELVHELASYLKRARYNPELRFETP